MANSVSKRHKGQRSYEKEAKRKRRQLRKEQKRLERIDRWTDDVAEVSTVHIPTNRPAA